MVKTGNLYPDTTVVEAQKDYHRIRGNLLPDEKDTVTKPMRGGGGGTFGYTPVYTPEPPTRTRPPPPPGDGKGEAEGPLRGNDSAPLPPCQDRGVRNAQAH